MTEDLTDLLERMQAARGYSHPAHGYLAEHDPEFLLAWDSYVSAALLHKGSGDAALPVKYRELIVACLLALLRVPTESVANHLRRAMADGLSEQEAAEAFQAASVPGGAPVLMQGIKALMMIAEPGS